jgi:hypothetical protein
MPGRIASRRAGAARLVAAGLVAWSLPCRSPLAGPPLAWSPLLAAGARWRASTGGELPPVASFTGGELHRWRASPVATFIGGVLHRWRASPVATFIDGDLHRWRPSSVTSFTVRTAFFVRSGFDCSRIFSPRGGASLLSWNWLDHFPIFQIDKCLLNNVL